MAFSPDTLNVVLQTIGGAGPRWFFYQTDDGATAVLATNYFRDVASRGMKIHDLVFVVPIADTFDPYTLVIDTVSAAGHGTAITEPTAILNPEMFGCKGDGTTVDDAGFLAFLQACVSTGLQGELIGSKTYLLDNVLLDGGSGAGEFPTGPRLHLRGNGGTIKANTTGSVLMLQDIYAPVIEGVNFVGLKTAADTAYVVEDPPILLHINFCSAARILNNNFYKGPGFGVCIERSYPGTRHRGGLVFGNSFDDWSYDGTRYQCGIFLTDNGEYNEIAYNVFEGLPMAIRGAGGANTMISFNRIMGCNNTDETVANDRGMVFFELGDTNEGKVSIIGNSINHNEKHVWAINIAGSQTGTNPENSIEVINNKILVHGEVTVGPVTATGQILRIRGYNGCRILGNHFRANASNPPGYQVWLDNCLDTIVGANHFQNYGTDGCVRLIADTAESEFSSVIDQGNVWEDLETAYSRQNVNCSVHFSGRRNVSGRLAIDGSLAAGTDMANLGWTTARPNTGEYTITHNLDTQSMSVVVSPESAVGWYVTKADDVITVFTVDLAGSPLNSAFGVEVTLWDGYDQPIYQG
jgi:hypothetical protein